MQSAPDWLIRIGFFASLITLFVVAYKLSWIREFISLIALIFAISIPYQINVRDRQLQNISDCVDSVLSLRESLGREYALQSDQFGIIQDRAIGPDNKPTTSPGDIRVTAQNAKDSTYILCRIFDFIDMKKQPWSSAPMASSDDWYNSNVGDLYAWTAETLNRAQDMKPLPLQIPFTSVPIWG